LQRAQSQVRAVDDVSFFVRKGETLGLVGESGCGKTTLGRAILRLVEPTSGQVLFEGADIARMRPGALKKMRRHMQIVFQNPFSALDPHMPIGESIGEGLIIHDIGRGEERYERVEGIMVKVGLYPEHARRYPHEFSAGQLQRIGIARALVLQPKFMVCDEPVSALDVSIQSQVLNLLRRLQAEFSLTYLFIAHNLGVVEHISDRVAVMYLGKIVELTSREDLYENPLHPYTLALMSAIPVPNPTANRERIILRGDAPSPLNPPSGCRFHPRCPLALSLCREVEPESREVYAGHWVACHRVS
jgi:peptide/nickel transport system ATP-binding protein/oligopeptide transport system ATP-binding protein